MSGKSVSTHMGMAALVLFMASCKTKVPPEPETPIDETVDNIFGELNEPEPPPPPTRPVYNPAEKRVNDVLHTRLEVSFDWENHRLNGVATIDLKPYFYSTDSLTLDAKGMDIKVVELIKDKERIPLTHNYDNLFLRINLDRTYERNEEYQIYIEYTAKPDEFEMGGSSAIAGDKGLYFINSDGSEVGKPTQIWTQGETEASSRWFPTIDAPNEKMTQEIEITVDEKYKTLSNGVLQYSTDNGDGTRTDYWKQSLPHTPYLVMMAVGDFAVVKDEWKRKDGKKIEVSYYLEHDYAPYARDIFGETPNMIQFFSDLLGVEYPWEKYSQVVVRDYVSGAMENTTATIHGEFLHRTKRELLDGHNESIIAHELFHHWFGDLVTCESWANLPLNESFANYSQYLWDEYRHGRDEADFQAFGEMEGYLYSSERQGYVDMIRYDYDDKEEMFDANSYNKGGRILHMLRKYVGDDAFFLSLQKYLEDNKFQPAEIDHLRLAFESVMGEDLHWFFDQWFLDKGHPHLVVTKDFGQKRQHAMIVVEQRQNTETSPVYKLPLDIDVYANDDVVRHRIVVDAVVDTFWIPISTQPDLVNVDAERSLLGTMDVEKTTEEYIFQYYNAPLYLDRDEALMACKSRRDSAAQRVVVDALGDKFWKIRETAMRNLRRAKRMYADEVLAKLKDLAANDEKSQIRAVALAMLQKHFSGADGLMDIYENALKDSSYYVMGTGLQSVFQEDADKAYALASEYEDEKSSSLKTTIGDIYAEIGRPANNDFYINNWVDVSGFERISFLKTYSRYLQKQNDDILFKGMDVFKEVAKNGGSMWVKYFAGYQTIMEFQEYFHRKAEQQKADIAKLEAEGANPSDVNLLQRDLVRFEENRDKLNAIMEELKAQETDQTVLDFLEGGAMMEVMGGGGDDE